MIEIWKSIKGYEGIYEISNFGNIKSFKVKKDGYILSLKNKKGDYLRLILSNYQNTKKETILVHREVAKTFISNPHNYKYVNHIDGNKQNNKVSNLEWITASGNTKHAIKLNENMMNGIFKYNKEVRPKTIFQYDLNGKFINKFINAKEAEKATNICSRNILQVASKSEYKPGKTRKQAGGYVWRFE